MHTSETWQFIHFQDAFWDILLLYVVSCYMFFFHIEYLTSVSNYRVISNAPVRGTHVYIISGVTTGGAREAEPWQWKICQKLGKKEEKLGKKRKNREEKAKIRKLLSLCPSWQIGLVTLLYIIMFALKHFAALYQQVMIGALLYKAEFILKR